MRSNDHKLESSQKPIIFVHLDIDKTLLKQENSTFQYYGSKDGECPWQPYIKNLIQRLAFCVDLRFRVLTARSDLSYSSIAVCKDLQLGVTDQKSGTIISNASNLYIHTFNCTTTVKSDGQIKRGVAEGIDRIIIPAVHLVGLGYNAKATAMLETENEPWVKKRKTWASILVDDSAHHQDYFSKTQHWVDSSSIEKAHVKGKKHEDLLPEVTKIQTKLEKLIENIIQLNNPETKIIFLTKDLKAYHGKKLTEQKAIEAGTKWNSISAFFYASRRKSTKVSFVEKFLDALTGTSITFTNDEIAASQNGELGKIVSGFRDAGLWPQAYIAQQQALLDHVSCFTL